MAIIPTVWVLLSCVMQTTDAYDIEISCLSESIPEKYRDKKRVFSKIQVKGCVLWKDSGGSYFLRGKMADKTDVYIYWKSRYSWYEWSDEQKKVSERYRYSYIERLEMLYEN